MKIPFDNNSGEKYSLEIDSENIETGDGVILTVNRKACESFAKIFADLANSESETHIHLGYDEECPQGPGFIIVSKKDI